MVLIALAVAPLATVVGGAGGTPSSSDLSAQAASEDDPSSGITAELLELGGVEGDTGLDPATVDTLASQGEPADVTSPAAMVDWSRHLVDRAEQASTASEAFEVAAWSNRVDLSSTEMTAPQAPLDVLILRTYDHLGVEADLQTRLKLHHRTADLDSGTSEGLSIVVHGVNQALVLEKSDAPGSDYRATALVLDALERAGPYFGTSASTSSHSPIFEDPTGWIIVGSNGDDTYDETSRLIQIDPAGNDTYHNQAGGATGTNLAGGELAEATITANKSLPETVGEVRDNATLGPVTNVTNVSQVTSGQWHQEMVDALTSNDPEAIANNATASTVEFVEGLDVKAEVNTSAVLANPPVSVTFDRRGDDVYDSELLFSQGAAFGGVGVLADREGSDSYSAPFVSQGFGTQGVGLLVDSEGPDTYSGGSRVQGASDAGFLLDLGSTADSYTAGSSSQAGRVPLFSAPKAHALLLDKGGDDSYSASGRSQGVGNVLVDVDGADTYTVDSPIGEASQGGALGTAAGFLVDGNGSDQYTSNLPAQGVSTAGAPGGLIDHAGDDTYETSEAGQGRCIIGTALLFDGGGNDAYSAAKGQGLARSGCVAALVDVSGDDIYKAGANSQGASFVPGSGSSILGALIDGSGDDIYHAGDHSQGAGPASGAGGAGLLVDAFGSDEYQAGVGSQGSGGAAGTGLGILVDGVQPATGVHAKAKVQHGPNKVQVDARATALPQRGAKDTFSAGNFSQGSSGQAGGVGILLDNRDESDGRVMYDAGHHSQASATNGGVGLLANREGQDSYDAGAFSQAGSDGGHALLVEKDGNDHYSSLDSSTSQGFANSTTSGTPPGVATASLVDSNGSDQYSAPVSNDACTSRGDVGFTVDVSPGTVPANCDQAAVNGVEALVAYVQKLVQEGVENPLTPEDGREPSSQTVYFFDDMEGPNAANRWTTQDNSLLVPHPWRVVNQSVTPQPTGPNAHSGFQYWHASAVGYPGVTYERFAKTELISSEIDLTSASNPGLSVDLGGTSESGFDELSVKVWNLSSQSNTTLKAFSDGRVLDDTDLMPQYFQFEANLSEFAGHRVRLVFQFQSDIFVEDGQGWNVDDVRVQED